jgi:hypothetical protein
VTPLWTRDAALAATGGTSPRDWAASGVSIDTRSLEPGDLFVALRDTRDGHDFVGDALARGAAAALVSRLPEGVDADAPLLIVPDVLDGLRALAGAGRARFRGQVVAVTGSVGKTGAKEMLRTALSAQGARVHAAEKSFNNHWGVPLTLARLPETADFAVIEIGMNAPGEIEPLARLARPHVALVTTVAAVHLEAFPDLRGIAREKASIWRGLEPGGTAVMPRDIATYPVLLGAARRAGARLLRFGATGRPEFRLLEAHTTESGVTVKARAHGVPFLFKLGAPGRHLAMNALGVLAAVEASGRRSRPCLPRARPVAGARGSGRAHAHPARPGRARRLDRPDRRELQRQSRGDGGGLRGLRRHGAGARCRADRPRPPGRLSRRHAGAWRGRGGAARGPRGDAGARGRVGRALLRAADARAPRGAAEGAARRVVRGFRGDGGAGRAVARCGRHRARQGLERQPHAPRR